jgi:hypothetical protein
MSFWSWYSAYVKCDVCIGDRLGYTVSVIANKYEYSLFSQPKCTTAFNIIRKNNE